MHALPPSMGTFKLLNVADYSTKLPQSILCKGGIFLSMYQFEAMWMSFKSSKPVAVKVSVGGVNALTGLPQNESKNGVQDFLPVGGDGGQLWLDGISVAPGVVRQFVAMPLGKGYTVEGQVTGVEDIGGIQIDVFPLYDTSFIAKHGERQLNIYKTPKQLGLGPGSHISYLDNPSQYPKFMSSLEEPYSPKGSQVELRGIYEGEDGHTLSSELQVTSAKRSWRPHGGGRGCARGGGFGGRVDPTNIESGFAAGGQISQKINRDRLPVTAYDQRKSERLHVSVINAAYFSTITGLPSPPTPISAQTYLKYGFPWYALYDEHVPAANNASGANALAEVRSVGQLMAADASAEAECGFCSYEMATLQLVPCGHKFCDDCANTTVCPACRKLILRKTRFSAPMVKPGNEEKDGVDVLSMDERIVKLQVAARQGKVLSFTLAQNKVSQLCGEIP